jgi:hypothetical protein
VYGIQNQIFAPDPALDSVGRGQYVAHLPKHRLNGGVRARLPRACVPGQRDEMGHAAMHAPWSWENLVHGTYRGR